MPDQTIDLGSFDGYPILGSAVKITKAGDGLSQALKVDPRRIHKGERLLLLLEVEAGPVTMKPAPDEMDGWVRVDTLEATGVTFVPAALEADVRARLKDTADRIKVAAEEARGVNRLPIGEALEKAHADGDHSSGLVPGCPLCQAEADAVADEAENDLEADPFTDPAPPPPTSKPVVEKVTALAGRASRTSRRAQAE